MIRAYDKRGVTDVRGTKGYKFIGAVLLLNVLLTACAGQNDSYNSSIDAVSLDGIVSEDMVSSNVIMPDEVSENTILSLDTSGAYEDRQISYHVEDYIDLSMEDTYAWLAPYGFVISSDQNDGKNRLYRYTEDGKEDRTVLFIYSETGELEHISINDFGEAKEEWTLYGMNCRMTVEEMTDWVKDQGAAIFGHNMVLYGTGIGFEKLGIGKISWGCGSDCIDFMDIDINTDYVDFLQNVTCQIENRKAEFVTEDGATFAVVYPVFVSGNEKIFDTMNEQLRQIVEENGEALCRAGNRDNILYEIECLETQGISLSFYQSGDEHYQSVFTFNYDLANEETLPMPDDFQEELESHREMLKETGAYSILNWYINPMQAHMTYTNQTSGEETGFDFWRR